MGQYCFAVLSSVTLLAGAWMAGAPAAGHVGGQEADTTWRASTATACYGDTLFLWELVYCLLL